MGALEITREEGGLFRLGMLVHSEMATITAMAFYSSLGLYDMTNSFGVCFYLE
jgi:hypothetical protein